MKKALSVLVAVLVLSLGANAQVIMQRGAKNAMNSHRVAGISAIHRAAPVQHAAAKAAGDTISEFPYSLDFENEAQGWTFVDLDGDEYNWTISEFEESHSGTHVLRSDSYVNYVGELTPDNWFISPAIVVPEDQELSFSWYVAAVDENYAQEKYSVYVLTTLTASANPSVAPVYTEVLPEGVSTFAKHAIDLSSYAGQTIYVAFRHYDVTDMFAMMIDDIQIKTPGLPEVSINAPRSCFFGDTVVVKAVVEDGLRPITFEWNIENADILEANDDNDSLVVLFTESGVDTIVLIATNDLGEVRATFAINVVNCSEVITEFPYTHDFVDAYDCWHGEGWITEGLAIGELPVAASFSFDDEDNNLHADNWLYSPEFEIPSDTIYEFEYIVALGGGAEYPGDHYAFCVVTEDSTYVLKEETLEDGDFLTRKVALNEFAGQVVRFAFHHFNTTQGYALCVATPSIHLVSLPEVVLKTPASARNTDNVTLKAEAISSLPVEYAWTIQGATPATAGNVAEVSAAWTGAEEGDYTVTVTATTEVGTATATKTIHIFNCANALTTAMTADFTSGFGCWTTMDPDGDGYNWMTIEESFVLTDGEEGYGEGNSHTGADGLISWSTFPSYSFMLLSYFGFGEPLNTNNYLVSPEIQVTAGQSTLSFWLETISADVPENFEVRVKTGNAPTNANDFQTVLHPMNAVPFAEGWIQYGINLAAYEGQSIYLAFVHQANAGLALLLDDIAINNSTVGVDNIEMTEVAVYPNPTTGVVNVMAENVLRVDVLDLNGRVVKTQAKAGVLDMETLSDGIYFVRVVTENGTSMRKVVKK